jgi:hypothetical protein
VDFYVLAPLVNVVSGAHEPGGTFMAHTSFYAVRGWMLGLARAVVTIWRGCASDHREGNLSAVAHPR